MGSIWRKYIYIWYFQYVISVSSTVLFSIAIFSIVVGFAVNDLNPDWGFHFHVAGVISFILASRSLVTSLFYYSKNTGKRRTSIKIPKLILSVIESAIYDPSLDVNSILADAILARVVIVCYTLAICCFMTASLYYFGQIVYISGGFAMIASALPVLARLVLLFRNNLTLAPA